MELTSAERMAEDAKDRYELKCQLALLNSYAHIEALVVHAQVSVLAERMLKDLDND